MEIRASGPTEAYQRVLRELLDAPKVSPRGLEVREISERVSVVIEKPLGLVKSRQRKLNHAISVLEGLSLVGQCSVPELQTDRVSVLSQFMSGGVFRGSYGPRIEGSLFDLVRLLKADPSTRQAVLSIYDSHRDLGRWDHQYSRSGDVPCTLSIQFLIRKQKVQGPDDVSWPSLLHMWVTMRSNDAWRGLPYDFGQFVILHSAVAQALSMQIGTYTHSVGSMHLYEEHYEDARNVVFSREIPYEHSTVWPIFRQGLNDIEGISIRARRILIGHDLSDEHPDERWMSDCLDMSSLKQVLEW